MRIDRWIPLIFLAFENKVSFPWMLFVCFVKYYILVYLLFHLQLAIILNSMWFCKIQLFPLLFYFIILMKNSFYHLYLSYCLFSIFSLRLYLFKLVLGPHYLFNWIVHFLYLPFHFLYLIDQIIKFFFELVHYSFFIL